MTKHTYTDQERDMARLGYVYSRHASRNGLRAVVRHLDNRTRADLLFDVEAYVSDHIGHGLTEKDTDQ